MERKRQFYRVRHAETIAIQDITGLLVADDDVRVQPGLHDLLHLPSYHT